MEEYVEKEYIKTLQSQIKELEGVFDELFEVYGSDFGDYFDDYIEKHSMLDLPFEVPCNIGLEDSPTTVKNLELYARYLLDLIRNYFGMSYPYKTGTHQVFGVELSKIDQMDPATRSSYLKDQNQDVVEAWVLHQLEQRRKEESLRKLKKHEEALLRYEGPDKEKAEELAASEDARKGLREILKLWIEAEETKRD